MIQHIDFSILNFIQFYLRSDFLDHVMIGISRLGNGGAIWIFIGVLLLFFKKYRRYGIMILTALLIEFLIVDVVLKPMVQRIRPYNINSEIELLVLPPKSYSFPSGHAGSSFAVATVIKFINKKFAAFVIIFSILMAFSRLYLYVHFPSDVIAGILVGISCGLLAIKIYDKFYNFIKMQKL